MRHELTNAAAAMPSSGPQPAGSATAPPRTRVTTRPDSRWDALLICIAGYILVAVGRVHELFPALAVVRPVTITGGLAILLYVLDKRADRRLHLVNSRMTYWLLSLVAWMIASIPGALVAGSSFDLVIGNVLKTVAMFFVVAAAVRGGRDLARLTGAYLLGCALYSVVVLLRFDVGGDDWRLGDLYYYDSNDFATFAVTAMPLAIYFAHRGRTLTVKVLAVLALGVVCAAFVHSGSRGGFLALLAMGLYIALRYSSVPLSRRVIGLGVVAAVLLIVASERYWQQMGSILSDTDYNQVDESGRLRIWQRGVGYMLSRPVFGVGANNFAAAEGTISPMAERQQFGVGVRWNAPHNSFIQVGAELGIPGLILFIGLIGSAFVGLNRVNRFREPVPATWRAPRELTQALTASLIGFVVGAFFLSLAYSELLFMLLTFAAAAQKIARIPIRQHIAR
jgi:O-antigen ligase